MTPEFDTIDEAPRGRRAKAVSIHAEAALNPEPRLPVVLVLDCSPSMQGAPLDALNAGIADFVRECQSKPIVAKRVELSIVTLPPVQTAVDWISIGHYQPERFAVTDQGTPLHAGLLHALTLAEARKRFYKPSSTPYFRPMIFAVTDGQPTDADRQAEAIAAIERAHGEKRAAVWAFHVDTEGLDAAEEASRQALLRQTTGRDALALKVNQIGGLMQFLSASVQTVSQSRDHERPEALPDHREFLGVGDY